EIRAFFFFFSQQYTSPANLYLLGGSALCFLGNPRRTVDIYYTFLPSSDLAHGLNAAIESLANKMHLELEVVPIEEFVPLPADSDQRHQFIEKFGNLAVYIYDPYTIALSKLSRGFETDLQDVLFLLRQKIIELSELTRYVEAALPQAWDFDIDPKELRLYFNEVRRQMDSGEK
ncbi:MAG: hypothetical protein GY943_00300, partial [Chloroflexi bacterium]|nr:hypothetical protein [Chloroflexota bacterium]